MKGVKGRITGYARVLWAQVGVTAVVSLSVKDAEGMMRIVDGEP